MPLVGTLIDFVANTKIVSSDVDQNFADIRTAFNTSAVLTDVAKTITVTHTFTPTQTFTGGASFGAAINFTGVAAIQEAGVERVLISGGVLTLGHSVTTGGSAGDIAVANGKGVYFVRSAGTAVSAMLTNVAGTNATQIHCNASDLYITGPITFTTAGAIAGYIRVNIDGTQRKLAYYAV